MAAMPQQMSPAVLCPFRPSGAMPVTMAETIAPVTAKGMSSQFSAPKNGAKVTSTPSSAKIPQTRLRPCMTHTYHCLGSLLD